MAVAKTLNVEGMSCAHCKAAIEEELDKIAGIECTNADPEKGTIELRYDDTRVSPAELEGAIQEAGYTLKKG